MNVLHCNECGGTEDVSHVVLTVEKVVPLTEGVGVGLAKNDNLRIEGDLCATDLKAVTDMIKEDWSPDDMLSLGPRRRPDYSEVT